MVQIKEPQPHIQLTDAVDTDCAVIVGDPARVDVVAKFLDEPEKIMENREYHTVTGTYKGRKILVMSTGIGAPSAAIGIEELHNIGVKTVIRVGSCGALQPEIGLGDLIVGEGIVRDDGLTKKYAPEIYPAVPSFKLLALAKKYAPQAHFGIIRSHDGFYMDDNEEVEAFWAKKGVLGCDMESGALAVVGRLRGMETLSILNNVVLCNGDLADSINSLVNSADLVAKGQDESIKLALNILAHDTEE